MKQLLDQACSIAVNAGEAIMEIYGRDFNQYEKDDSSPLTEADLAAHKLIVTGLAQVSNLPILSEEGDIPEWSKRKTWHEYWIIDPLDGTKEFIKRNGEFTVNIALVRKGIPVLGVVYAPALDVLYFAAEGMGAFKLSLASKNQIESAEAIKVSPAVDIDSWRVVGSRSHGSEAMDAFLKTLPSYELVSMGSSLKLCLVAEGKADLYPRLAPTSEWDTAAANAVVLGAGGVVVKDDLTALEYNAKEDILNPHFIVASSISEQWADFFEI